jgi:hypothetical protein
VNNSLGSGHEGPAGQVTDPGDEKLIPWLVAHPKQAGAAAVTMVTIISAIAAIIATDTPAGKTIGGILFVLVAAMGFIGNRLWGHVNSRQAWVDILSAVALAVATGVFMWAAAPTRDIDIYVTHNVTIPARGQPQSRGITVQFVSPRDVQGQPLPTVECSMSVTGRGSVPAGDVLVLGSVIRGGTDLLPLQDVKWSNATSWHTTVYFGKASDANHIFDIDAIVIPEAWMDYLLSEANYYDAQSGETWWASGDPPAPAEVAASVSVMRLPVPQGRCA